MEFKKRTNVNEVIRLLNQLNIRVLNTLLFQDSMTPIRDTSNHLDVTRPGDSLIVIFVHGGGSSLWWFERREGVQITSVFEGRTALAGTLRVVVGLPGVAEFRPDRVPDFGVRQARNGFLGEFGDVVREREPVVRPTQSET